MLEFSFRNGPLRRKFDALKYAYRNVENIEFDLSMVQSPSASSLIARPLQISDADEGEIAPPIAKKLRSEPVHDVGVQSADSTKVLLLNTSEFDEIRVRLDTVDALREEVIKQCRTVQKNSKLAIYSIQRGALADADAKLKSCLENIQKIVASIQEVSSFMC